MTDTAGSPGDRIRSFIERVERIDEEARDRDGLLLANENDKALATRDAGVEEISLQHRVVLGEDRDDDAGYSEPWFLWMVAA